MSLAERISTEQIQGTAAGRRLSAQVLPFGPSGRRSATDWLRTFAFGLSKVGGCLERSVSVSEAADRSTLKLDVRHSSSRRHPPALYVGRQRLHSKAGNWNCRPTAAIRLSRKQPSTAARSGCSTARYHGLDCRGEG